MSQKQASTEHTVIYWYAKNGTQDQVDKQLGKVISMSSHVNLKTMKMDLMDKEGNYIMKDVIVNDKPNKEFVEVPLSSKRIMDLALAIRKLNWMKLPKGVTYAGVLDETSNTLRIGRTQTFSGREDTYSYIPPDTFIKEEGRKRAVGRALSKNPCILIKYDDKDGLGRAFNLACQQYEANEAKQGRSHPVLKFEKGELLLDDIVGSEEKTTEKTNQ